MTALDNAHAHFQRGDLDATRAALAQVAPADRNLDWHTLKAVTHALQGEFAAAERILQSQLNQHTDNLPLRINLGTVQLDQGNIPAALATFGYATQQHPSAVAAWHNLGIAQLTARNWDAAAQSLYTAAKLAPQQHNIRLHAALALARGGHTEAARAALGTLGTHPELEPGDWMMLGTVHMALRDNAAAQDAFMRVLESVPGHPEALINAATLQEQANQPEAAAQLLDALPGDLRGIPASALVQARLHQRAGHLQDALDSLPEHDITDPELAVELMFLRARLLDALGRYAEAHAAAATANAGARQLHTGATNTFDTLLEQTVDASQIGAWSSPVTDPNDQPVFLVGLPRSGSTLLDLMLDSHAQLQVLSESPCLERLIPTLEEMTGLEYPAALHSLTAEQIQQLQLQYFDCANRRLENRLPGTRLVDKNPLNLLRLPLIQRLFPGATIVQTTRDVHDAALSCFLNDLGGRGQQGFWSIEESLRILVRLLEFAREQSAALDITPHLLRYEDLVQAPRQQLEALCERLGLPFDPAMLEPAQIADRRGAIGTPSYVEVTQPIHDQRIGRWRHYVAYFPENGAVFE